VTHRLIVPLRDSPSADAVEYVRDTQVDPHELPTQSGQSFPFGADGRLRLRVAGIVSCDGAWCISADPVVAGGEVSRAALEGAGFERRGGRASAAGAHGR
jgi:hypothetical protein